MKVLLAIFVLVGVSLVSAAQVDWMRVKLIRSSERLQQRRPESRILGGSLAARGQFPFHAAVFGDSSGFCEGTLISDRAVLTAAACTWRYSSFEIHLGTTRTFDPPSLDPGHVVVTSQERILHPGFNISRGFQDNFALVILPSPVQGDFIAPVRLPARSHQESTFEEETAFIMGWGTIDDLNPWRSEDLRYAAVRVTSVAECQLSYGTLVVTGCHVCASTNQGSVGLCSGDAGTSLTVTEEDGALTTIGVASFGHPMGCEKPDPNVFGRITCYLDWIEQNAPGVSIRP